MMLLAFIGLLGVSMCYAASFANVAVSAQVPNSSPELTISVRELTQANQDPSTGTDVTLTGMNFGQLTHYLANGTTEANQWYAIKYYCVLIYSQSYGHKYEVRSTCAALSNGTTTLPTGSFMITPGYSSADKWNPSDATGQGAIPTGAATGTPGSAVATNKVIYTSETAASNRIIRSFYSLPGYLTGGVAPFTGYQPIPLNQAGGTTAYTTTVTITIAQI